VREQFPVSETLWNLKRSWPVWLKPGRRKAGFGQFKEALMTARTYDGWPLFSYGFRPFFLLGSIYAGLAIALWIPVLMGELSLTTGFTPRDWHVHEMLYGFLPAVITGFLFTAIPNWTGRLPLRGWPLMFLVALWIAGPYLCDVFHADRLACCHARGYRLPVAGRGCSGA
jgi:NnrS protein